MSDRPFIIACGLPPMLVEACKALGLYLPVRSVEERHLEHLRPEAWIVSAAVFAAHLDFLMPYRRHVLVYVGEEETTSELCISLRDDPDRWMDAFARLEREGSPFGEDTATAPLTQREKDVLRLIAAGLTARKSPTASASPPTPSSPTARTSAPSSASAPPRDSAYMP